MDHNFTPSLSDPTVCGKCKFGVIAHTDLATCECCPNKGNMSIYAGMLMCDDCIQKEKDHQSPEKQAERLAQYHATLPPKPEPSGILNINNLLDKARAVDYAVKVVTDIFNAETIATTEILASVENDETIPAAEKQFKKAEFLQTRQEHFQKVIFDANQTVVDAQNRLRVVQQELNKIVNTLRAEEREKLKILSPEYKPGEVKKPKDTVSKPRAKKVKFDKKELMDTAAKLIAEGYVIEWSNLQMICTRRDMTPAQAADVVRKMQAK